MKNNYYSILNLEENATSLEIKRAYKRLANIYHPDKTHNDPVKTEFFKKIVIAYETLSDLNKKSIYDDNLKKSFENTNESPEPEKKFYQYSKTETFKAKDNPIYLDVYIDWLDTINGTTKTLSFSIIKFCNTCAGRGIVYSKICQVCLGTGQKAFDKKYKTIIPKETLPESQIRLKGVGHQSKPDFEQGDVILDIHWKKGKWVFIDGDVYTYLYLTKRDRIKKKITFINYNNDKTIVYLPDNIQEGQLLRLKNKGWELSENIFSDLYLEIRFKETNIFKKLFDKFS